MSSNKNIRLDPSCAGTSGAGRKVTDVGGGSLLGVLLIFGLSYLTGIDLTSLLSTSSGTSSTSSLAVDTSTCQTGQDANTRIRYHMVVTAQSLGAVWKTQLSAQDTGVAYQLPDFQISTNSVSIACGNATSAVGPFYCPGDSTVYLDPGFFGDIVSKYGVSDPVLAQEYVVAHEWGRHTQNIQGVFRIHDTRESGEQGAGVRSELQADCYAGVWIHWASSTPDPSTGTSSLKTPTADEVLDALQTAQAIGDDRLQERYQGSSNPETWTHGSAQQRATWLQRELDSGDISTCDIWSISRV